MSSAISMCSIYPQGKNSPVGDKKPVCNSVILLVVTLILVFLLSVSYYWCTLIMEIVWNVLAGNKTHHLWLYNNSGKEKRQESLPSLFQLLNSHISKYIELLDMSPVFSSTIGRIMCFCSGVRFPRGSQ